MKKLIVLIVLFMPVLASAQSASLIFRIDNQVGNTPEFKQKKVSLESISKQIESVSRTESFDLRTKPLLRQFEIIQTAPRSITVTFDDTMALCTPGLLSKLEGTIINRTKDTVRLIFRRNHLRLPEKWTTSVCFGDLCYLATKDSLEESSAFPFAPNTDPIKFTLNVFCPAKTTTVDSVIDYIRLTVLSGYAWDTVAFTLKGVSNPPSGIDSKQPSVASPRIISLYPSPLVEGNMIKVKIGSPRESSFTYSIYDPFGRSVAFGSSRKHIGLGESTIEINALEGLSTGSYMLKLNFNEGGSDTKFFQVIR